MISKIMKWALAKVPRPILIRLSYIVQWLSPVLFKGSKFIDPIDGRGILGSFLTVTVKTSDKMPYVLGQTA